MWALHIGAISSLHRGTPCYEHDLGVNFNSIMADLHVLRIPYVPPISGQLYSARYGYNFEWTGAPPLRPCAFALKSNAALHPPKTAVNHPRA